MLQTLTTDSGTTVITAAHLPVYVGIGSGLSNDLIDLLEASVGAGHVDGSAQVVYVLKVAPYNRVTSASEALYFASTTFRTNASDAPANTPMLGVLTPPNVRASGAHLIHQ